MGAIEILAGIDLWIQAGNKIYFKDSNTNNGTEVTLAQLFSGGNVAVFG
jgi:hypothetical protein